MKVQPKGFERIPPAPVIRIIRPFQAFAENKAAGRHFAFDLHSGGARLGKFPRASSYTALWHTELTISVGSAGLRHDLHFWVNDLLMVIFFFLVGLEIKREVLVGELASVRQAILPIVAAAGGVAVPAILYSLVNAGGPGAHGWAFQWRPTSRLRSASWRSWATACPQR